MDWRKKRVPPCSTVLLRYNMTWDDGRKHIVNKSSHFGCINGPISAPLFFGDCDFQAWCQTGKNYSNSPALLGIYVLKSIEEYTYYWMINYTLIYIPSYPSTTGIFDSWTPRNQSGFSRVPPVASDTVLKWHRFKQCANVNSFNAQFQNIVFHFIFSQAFQRLIKDSVKSRTFSNMTGIFHSFFST